MTETYHPGAAYLTKDNVELPEASSVQTAKVSEGYNEMNSRLEGELDTGYEVAPVASAFVARVVAGAGGVDEVQVFKLPPAQGGFYTLTVQGVSPAGPVPDPMTTASIALVDTKSTIETKINDALAGLDPTATVAVSDVIFNDTGVFIITYSGDFIDETGFLPVVVDTSGLTKYPNI